MSSWHPTDLIADADLSAYEQAILTQFGQADWTDKRRKTLEDWLFPILRVNGLNPDQLRTRYEPDKVLGYTGAVYTDVTTAATDETTDDLNLATIFATPGTDLLYVGSEKPFRGLSIRMLDSVSAVAGTLAVKYWADSWTALTVTDGTLKTAGKPFSGGGAITWLLPVDWVTRAINASDPYYYVQVSVTAVPTSAKASQIGVIQRSALCAPAAFRTLALIMREAPTGGPGPWTEKALWYEGEADLALQRALQIVGGEFDTDESEQVSDEEAAQTAEEAGGGPFRLERA